MDANKLSAVRIAVKEAPTTINRKDPARSERSIVKYPTGCTNSLVVGGNVYNFDCVFRPSTTQTELYYGLIQPMVIKFLAGTDCTVLAYGQTGTGKSYSMGLAYTNLCEEQHWGIAPRCLSEILNRLSQDKENRFVSPRVFASFIEVYNEKAYDLLQTAGIQPICSRGQRFVGGTQMPIQSQQDLHNILLVGTQNRHVRPTNMNANSSRSHAILSIYTLRPDRPHFARFNIVDLAGSEGVRRTGHEGIARQEGVFINQGLLSINKVLMSMSAGHAVIPFRDSVLTTVLQESLNARSYLTLLACISPYACDLSETNSTLHFAKSAKRLKLTRDQSNFVQMHLQQQSRFAAATTIATPAAFPRLLPSSTTIKRRPIVREGALSNFCNPSNVKNMLYRTRSEMGLTPKAKDYARQELNIIDQTPLMDVSRVSNANNPTYLKLKMQIDELQRQLDRLTAQTLEENPSILNNYREQSSTTLSSITEERLQQNEAPTSPLFTSSPVNITGITRVSIRSSMSAENSTLLNAVEDLQAPTSRRAVLPGRTQKLTAFNNLVVPRRSLRIAMREEAGRRNSPSRSHCDSLLALLNKGNIKDLQKLPSIGPKTASCIIIQRNTMGRFKSWHEVKSLPIWPGTSWNRFAARNCLNV